MLEEQKVNINSKTSQKKRHQSYLSASIAEPSSNNSSTTPTAESLLADLPKEFGYFFPKNEVSTFCFFLGVDGIKKGCSDGIISTTKQVVSSFNPLDRKASYNVLCTDQN